MVAYHGNTADVPITGFLLNKYKSRQNQACLVKSNKNTHR